MDIPESAECIMLHVVVDTFPKMVHIIPIGKKNSLEVAGAYLNRVCKYHRFPEHVVSDRDGTLLDNSFKIYNTCLQINIACV